MEIATALHHPKRRRGELHRISPDFIGLQKAYICRIDNFEELCITQIKNTMKEAGYVYILTNLSFKEDWVKIGKSSRPVDIRSKELDNKAVPLPFEIYATLKRLKAKRCNLATKFNARMENCPRLLTM